MIVINPGSENKGGTIDQAKKNARKWLKAIHEEGFSEVVMSEGEHGDYFEFLFTHNVTKKVATLRIHGFTEEERKEFMFSPRVYWNGSSTGDPKIEDWLEEGFKYRIEYYR